ncbi:hypothetical protein [Paenibacillus rigui]|uniref:Uncharacterized protein n=1 Tax=Paenibacillus rigui TaxID=554312 RepID=A0A229USS3_9BACL|nr:hypothetical protein [Paenibacillus rigui]OXM85949.1 hypothetical protein CF651_12015 [Paenibacillus rigui]
MDERTLKKALMNTPFSYPLVEGNPLNLKVTDPRLKVKCCYITVVTLGEGNTKEVFIKPDATFIVTRATYNYGTYELKVNREIEGDSVTYEELPQHIGEEHMNLIDERLHFYLYKSISKL